MKVDDVQGNYEKRDAFHTLSPLNFALKWFGLNCVYRDGASLKYVWCLRKITSLIFLLGVLNVFNLYNKLYIWKGRITFQFKDAIQVIFLCGYFQYLLDLYFLYKHGRHNAVHYYSIYDNIDKILGMTYYNVIRRCIIKLMISLAIISLTMSTVDFAAWYISYGTAVIVAYFIDYFYVMLRNLSFADVIAQVTQVSFRLRVIGDLLKDFYFLSETSPGIKDIVAEKNGIKIAWKDTRPINPGSVKTMDQYKCLLRRLSECYLMILEQCDYINTMYGVRILGMFLSALIDMVMTLNLAFRIVMGSLVTTYYSGFFPAISSLLRLLASAVILFYEVYRCEECYSQIMRIVRYIDYLLINKKISMDTRETLMSFRLLVTTRPVVFHAINFFKLDYTLLLSVGSALVTYTIILLQNLK